MKVTVLGCGLIGKAIVQDLSKEEGLEIVAVDRSPQNLEAVGSLHNVTLSRTDLSDGRKIADLVSGSDLAIGALPGFMGFAALGQVIQAGCNVVDISFFPEDPFQLEEKAKDSGLTALVDCGLAPGLSHLLAGVASREFESLTRYRCYVGGLPRERTLPFQYKIVFSAVDVLEEYTRPARMLEQGRLVVREPLSDLELLQFAGLGTLEAFNTDGLRTLLKSRPAPSMTEKTLRYPGHVEKIGFLRDLGFLDSRPMRLGDTVVRPLDLTASLLFSDWQLKSGEEDLTVMRVIVEGMRESRPVRRTWELFDRYDPATGTTSMARTTGFTCALAARLVLEGKLNRPGIIPPEELGLSAQGADFILQGLQRRGTHIVHRDEELAELSDRPPDASPGG